MTMGGAEVCCDWVRLDFKPMSRASILLPLTFRKFLLIQDWRSSRQVMRDGNGEVGGDVDLCVIGVAMNECAKGEEINDEKKWTQD